MVGHGAGLLCDCDACAVQNGWSCLTRASRNGHLDVVKHLCEVGGETLLMLTHKVRERVAVLLCVYV